MIVLSLGLTTLILVLRYSVIQFSSSHFYTLSNWLCQEKMEEIVSDRRDSGFNYIVNSNYPDEPSVSGFALYNRTVRISYVELSDLTTPAAGPTDYKRVEVSVDSGNTAPTELYSVVTRYD